MELPAKEAPATPAVVCRNSRRERKGLAIDSILLLGTLYLLRAIEAQDSPKR
jgi:hypothetical protein